MTRVRPRMHADTTVAGFLLAQLKGDEGVKIKSC